MIVEDHERLVLCMTLATYAAPRAGEDATQFPIKSLALSERVHGGLGVRLVIVVDLQHLGEHGLELLVV